MSSTVFFVWGGGIRYSNMIRKQTSSLDISYTLVLAIIKTESNFIADAQSNKGAIGLMQLMPSTAEWVAEKYVIKNRAELTNAEYNVKIGCLFLSYLLERYSVKWAVAAYNAGETNVDRWINQGIDVEGIPFCETKNYVKKVLSSQKVFGVFITDK